MARVLLMVGTRKGAFFFWSNEARREWRIEGPLIKGWEVGSLALDRRGDQAVYAGVGHFVYGPTIQVSRDFGDTWKQIENGPRYGESSALKLNRIWTVVPGHESEPGVLYAGVDEAGLFVSRDGGVHWREVESLSRHPTRSEWSPGAGGLCCHTVLVDPADKKRLWVGISAVGVFRSDDGGATWEVKNEGLPIAAESEEFDNVGSCVHRLVLSPDEPGVLYQQNHMGVFRSADAGDSWDSIQDGLPSEFGFPMVMPAGDPPTLYVMPLESSEYRFFIDGRPVVYRSRDRGASWQAKSAGLPGGHSYTGVLRHCLAADGLGNGAEGGGIYFGTSGGKVYYSRDDGDSWQAMPAQLPRILSVTAAVLE